MMSYQTRMFIAIGTLFLLIAVAAGVAFVVTALADRPRFPDIIAEQPQIN